MPSDLAHAVRRIQKLRQKRLDELPTAAPYRRRVAFAEARGLGLALSILADEGATAPEPASPSKEESR